MRAIPNQPFIFAALDGSSPFPTESALRTNHDPGACVPIVNGDVLYIQFEREVDEEPVQPDLVEATLALNLVQDPELDNPIAWNAAGGWVVNGGKATQTGAATADLDTEVPTSSGIYILRFTVSNINAATVTPYLGSITAGNEGTAVTANGTYEMEIQRTVGVGNALAFRCVSGDVTIDDVELFKVVDGDPGTPINGWDWNVNDWLLDSTGIRHNAGSTSSLHFDGLTLGQHYRLTLEFDPSDEGYISVVNDATFLNVANENRSYYFFIAESTEFNLTPSSDFTGKITSAIFHPVEYFETDDHWRVVYSSEEDETSFDITDFIVYDDQYATLVFTLDNEVVVISNGCGQINLQKRAGGVTVETYFGNCLKRMDDDGTLSLLTATCKCNALGFDFNNFRLQQRLALDFTNPEYPFKMVMRNPSDGSKDLLYSERDKTWTVLTDHLDETAHDFLSAALLCDEITIDGSVYVFNERDYKVAWSERGLNLSAQARFKLTSKTSTIYNRNQGCGFKGLQTKVLYGWQAYTSYKQLDKFNLSNSERMIIRVDRFEINGVTQISGSPRYVISRDSGGNFSPELVLAEGINGNWSIDAGASTIWVQNGNQYINSLILDEGLIFHDGLSVIEIAPGTTFILDLSLSYNSIGYPTLWTRRRYTEEGMAFPAFSLTPVLTYVA